MTCRERACYRACDRLYFRLECFWSGVAACVSWPPSSAWLPHRVEVGSGGTRRPRRKVITRFSTLSRSPGGRTWPPERCERTCNTATSFSTAARRRSRPQVAPTQTTTGPHASAALSSTVRTGSLDRSQKKKKLLTLPRPH